MEEGAFVAGRGEAVQEKMGGCGLVGEPYSHQASVRSSGRMKGLVSACIVVIYDTVKRKTSD